MTPLFRKLNLADHKQIVVLNSPESFVKELDALSGVKVKRVATVTQPVSFGIAFVRTFAEVEMAASLLLPKAVGDATVWFAYPKGSSKRYLCEFKRDTGWAAVREYGFDTVRVVAIDEDWSALRFRRVEAIGR